MVMILPVQRYTHRVRYMPALMGTCLYFRRYCYIFVMLNGFLLVFPIIPDALGSRGSWMKTVLNVARHIH